MIYLKIMHEARRGSDCKLFEKCGGKIEYTGRTASSTMRKRGYSLFQFIPRRKSIF